MSRGIKSASSTTTLSSASDSSYLSGIKSIGTSEGFNTWNLISRKTLEDPFCMTCKFRMGTKIQRIRKTVVQRPKRKTEASKKTGSDEDATSSSSELSQDWDDFDDDADDLVALYEELNSQPLKKAAASLITAPRYTIHRPISGVEDVVMDIATGGSKAQKLYLKKCADFQTAPSRLFLEGLVLPVIDIGHQNVGPKGAEACAIALTQTRSVEILHMNGNAIGYRGAKYLAHVLKVNRNIYELNLADNNMGIRGARHLVTSIMDIDRITSLDLSNSGFKEQDAIIFKQLLEETRNLAYLNLSHNQFRETGGRLLGEALSYNDGLEELDLSWNHLRREGVIGIAEGLMDNTSLKRLNLAWNGFHLEGCLALERTLPYNTTLEALDLTNNRIHRECVAALARGLAHNITLNAIILRFNPLTQEGAHDMLQFLADCRTSGINLVDFGIMQVEPRCLARINEVHLQGRALRVIHGQIVGEMTSASPELERSLIEEHPALVLIEFGKLMGFRVTDLFNSLDKDGNRALDRDEIRKGLQMANIPLSDRSIDKLIERLDNNGNGEIEYDELLLAYQEYRKHHAALIEAQNGDNPALLEELPLWRIRTCLQKLMAEKMKDFHSFKRIADQIAKHLKNVNDEIEAKREQITRERARRPRKVRSRPTSSRPNGQNWKSTPSQHGAGGGQANDTGNLDDDDEIDINMVDSADPAPEESELTAPSTVRMTARKRMSIQLPINIRASSRNTDTSDEATGGMAEMTILEDA
ncbi:leucine-rich repeat-containing protein 74A-like [Mya arenaria]|uniref:leucine-rich repeat-containing protein 74A-like n=1 Tax=Mya arenaria TaxID=6604 RepID=UPI0022E54A19|nr:leucine-rich repeat-containing protein 74A-like [Mya arenaria]